MRTIQVSILFATLLGACVFPPTPVPPTPTTTPTGPCRATAVQEVTAYRRPSLAAGVFGKLSSGLEVDVLARTADGWLGFDPGVAQAGNTGVFRFRWIQESAGVNLEGGCRGLPVVVGPQAGICYTMPMEVLDVHASPDSSSPVLATLEVEDYAAVLGVMGTDWAKVDLSQGDPSLAIQGWIPASSLNMNGPCGSLPVVTPEP